MLLRHSVWYALVDAGILRWPNGPYRGGGVGNWPLGRGRRSAAPTGSGLLSSQRDRAATVGSIPIFFHHAASRRSDGLHDGDRDRGER